MNKNYYSSSSSQNRIIGSALELDGAILEIGEGLHCQQVEWDIWDTFLPSVKPNDVGQKSEKDEQHNVQNKLILVFNSGDYYSWGKNIYLIYTRLMFTVMGVLQFLTFVWNQVIILEEKGGNQHPSDRPPYINHDKRNREFTGWKWRMRGKPAVKKIDDYSSTEDEDMDQ